MQNVRQFFPAVSLSKFVVAAVSFLFAGLALAFTAPAAGDFGFDVYDIAITQIAGGPVGYVGAAALVLFGFTQIMTRWMITLGCIIAATVIIKLDAMIQTLGFTI